MRILTIDLEYDWESEESNNVKEAVPRLLDILDENGSIATFFVVGSLAEKYEDLLKEINKKHEIASHSFTHQYLNKLDKDKLEKEIINSKKAFEKIGITLKGFRAPYFITPKKLGLVLKKHGFLYDSSIASFFPFRYQNFLSPKKPYIASSSDLSKRGNDIIELPIPDFTPLRFPSAGFSYYKLFYPVSRIFKLPYLVYLHPCEFLQSKPSKNISPLVRKLYGRNRGKTAWKLLEKFLHSRKFIGCYEFLQKEGLINE